MIDVKKAVAIASQYIAELFKEFESQRLEEVQLTEDGDYWQVTISMLTPSDNAPPQLAILALAKPKVRRYKRVRIRASDGSFHGVTDRPIDSHG